MANAGGILGSGAAGAASFAPLGPVGAAAGGLLGLIGGALGGGKPREDAITHQARLNELNAQRGLMNFAQSVPGGSPDELAALAQSRGALGGQLRAQQQGIYGSFNPQMGTGGLADMLKNLSNTSNALQLSTNEAHLMNALAQRRQALSEVANAGSRIQGPTYQPMSDLPQVLGQVAQSIAYQMGRKQAGANTSGVPGGSGVPGDIPLTTPYGPQTMAGPPLPGALPYGGILGAAGFSPSPPDTAGVDALTGGLPAPLYLQDQTAGIQGAAASPDTAPGIPQPVAANNPANLSGLTGLNNQFRQAAGFNAPWAGGAATPPWLQF